MNKDIREEAKKEIFFDCDGDLIPNKLNYITSKEGINFLGSNRIDNLYEFACYLLANNYHLEFYLDDYLSRIDELVTDDAIGFDIDGSLDFGTMKEILAESYDQVTDWLEEYEEEVDALGKESFEILGTQFVRKYGNTLQTLIKEIAKNPTEDDFDVIDFYQPSFDRERQIELYNEYIV